MKLVKLLLLVKFLAVSQLALAQADGPLRIVVAFPPGAAVDLTARKIAPELSKILNKNIIIENRAGAGGNIAAQHVLRSHPDGLTLLYTAPATLVINKLLYPTMGFDYSSFEPVSLAVKYPYYIFTSSKTAYKSMKALDSAAKSNPNTVSFGSYGVGSGPHLLLESIKSNEKTEYLHVPFLGGAPAVTAVIGNQVDVSMGGFGAIATNVKAGKLVPLAVTTKSRDTRDSTIPTLGEIYPNVPPVENWFAFLAPPKTSPTVIRQISEALQTALKNKKLVDELAQMYITPVGSTPAELSSYMDHEAKVWSAVLKENNISIH